MKLLLVETLLKVLVVMLDRFVSDRVALDIEPV